MNPVKFDRFNRMATSQGVEIDDRVTEAGIAGHSSLPFTLEPTAMLAAIAEAGKILRKEPGRALANKPVSAPRRMLRDVAVSTLCKIVNTSISPDTRTTPAFNSSGSLNMDTCNITERLLQVTTDQLRSSITKEPALIRPGCQVIAEGERPLFLREAIGERICLALTKFTINGVEFPVGSLARIDLRDEVTTIMDGRRKVVMPDEGIETVPAHRIEHAAFIRLSAFALPIDQRAVFEADSLAREGWDDVMPRIMSERIDTIAHSVSEAMRL